MPKPQIWPSQRSMALSGVESEDISSEERLLESENCGKSNLRCHLCGNNYSKDSLRRWKVATIISCSFLALLILILSLTSPKLSGCGIPTIYSPAEPAVEYKTLVFRPNPYEDHTPYAGPPTDSVDEMWLKLYEGVTNVRIDGNSAELLPNDTLPIPGEEDKYVVGIGVFHQLHCLDTMRKALYPDRYRMREGLTRSELFKYDTHLAHCVEVIRHTVQCYSDITAIPWAWDTERNLGLPTAHTMHICRNFEKLQDWARERAFEEGEYAASLAAEQKKLANGM